MNKLINKIGQINLPTKFGEFKMQLFQNLRTGKFSAALIAGEVSGKSDVLLRVHSSCITGEIFGSLLCDCGPQLEQALQNIAQNGQGVIIYLDQEGRGIGLGNKIKAMEFQQLGLDTVEANLALGLPIDARTFEEAAEIIKELGIQSIRLITNNPKKIRELQQLGIKVSDRIGCFAITSNITQKYLKTKKERMGHLLPV